MISSRISKTEDIQALPNCIVHSSELKYIKLIVHVYTLAGGMSASKKIHMYVLDVCTHSCTHI